MCTNIRRCSNFSTIYLLSNYILEYGRRIINKIEKVNNFNNI